MVRILDVANANPRGAEMALEVISQFTGGSRILITPGMVELGSIEAEENRRFGEQADELPRMRLMPFFLFRRRCHWPTTHLTIEHVSTGNW